MSEAAVQFLSTFEALPLEEQHNVLVELLRRETRNPVPSLTDEDLLGLADELFQQLDRREASDDDTEAK